MIIPAPKQIELIKEIRERTAKEVQRREGQIQKSCFFFASYTVKVLNNWIEENWMGKSEVKPYCIIQAGSASWPFMSKEMAKEIPPEDPTHFAYEWEEHLALRNAIFIEMGGMPEVHVWAALIQEGKKSEIIDLTTMYWPAQALELQGIRWLIDHPPEHLWACKVPPGARYTPSPSATLLFYRLSQTPGMIP